mgnify:CR=1 FL=1
MKKLSILCLCAALYSPMQAQDFNEYFENKTLRTDYIFTGDAQKQEVYLDELSCLPQWAGRRHHLNELPLAGNGEITMKDKASGEVIYRTSFSSLFQEWLGEEEATRIKKGFENSFLLALLVYLRPVDRDNEGVVVHEQQPARFFEELHRGHQWVRVVEDVLDVSLDRDGIAVNQAQVRRVQLLNLVHNAF